MSAFWVIGTEFQPNTISAFKGLLSSRPHLPWGERNRDKYLIRQKSNFIFLQFFSLSIQMLDALSSSTNDFLLIRRKTSSFFLTTSLYFECYHRTIRSCSHATHLSLAVCFKIWLSCALHYFLIGLNAFVSVEERK